MADSEDTWDMQKGIIKRQENGGMVNVEMAARMHKKVKRK